MQRGRKRSRSIDWYNEDIVMCPPGKIMDTNTGKCIEDTTSNRRDVGIRTGKRRKIQHAAKIPSPVIKRADCPDGQIMSDHGCVKDDMHERRKFPKLAANPLEHIQTVTRGLPSLDTLNSISNHLIRDLDKYYKFKGTYVYEYSIFMYLKHKYKNSCTWIEIGGDQGITFSFNEDDASSHRFYVSPHVNDRIRQCSNRFIIGILNIHGVAKTGNWGHANAIIIDKIQNDIYRFEPHGTSSDMTREQRDLYNHQVLDFYMNKWAYGMNMTYRAPVDYCFKPGPQVIEEFKDMVNTFNLIESIGKEAGYKEEIGWCSVWSVIFIDLRIAHPDLGYDELYDIITSLSPAGSALLVRQYAEFIVTSIGINGWYIHDYIPIPIGIIVDHPGFFGLFSAHVMVVDYNHPYVKVCNRYDNTVKTLHQSSIRPATLSSKKYDEESSEYQEYIEMRVNEDGISWNLSEDEKASLEKTLNILGYRYEEDLNAYHLVNTLFE